ncbi:MAG: hypothetical protein BWY04_01234 [candidate division CPR1 bacterium ADurb.Bin160]|uniref:Polymer-forming cytoskeletal n=1 Tax=candidate division CPR1 bacterium ADurb.Bin160 TaxID=1852826 RepID=A0A1V5ZKF2_9BACT|nr:MAG: hypothetical protein BWY04_01234 [candidate division CPR1 bacterium ADurb.Bin160]
MDKKYELIKEGFNWPRVKALKDFTLITGEKVKKGDIGGCVVSEKCLSQEGNCWIMDNVFVEGKVSGNAVIQDYAKIYGEVSGNALVKDDTEVYGKVSGNAIVKDFAEVRENAIVTGNAVVQAYQYITFGTVTTDLLGTKDWIGALYAEFGIVPENGKITLYKRVWNTNNPNVFESVYNRKFIYEIGKEAIETDVDENVMNECTTGLHFATLEFINYYVGNSILECEIDLKDIITVQTGIVRARKCKVIRIYKGE